MRNGLDRAAPENAE